MHEKPLSLRQQVAQLLEDVLMERLSPQVAINRWPVPKTVQDPSLECAFWALWHFEADEVQQQTEMYYMDAQLELLRQMARFLAQDQDLPPYMLASYKNHAPVRFYYPHSPWRDYLQRLHARWNAWRFFWQRAFSLISGKQT
jgi:HrpA-like RNA helicase